MERRNIFIVSVLLVSLLTFSGMLCAQRVIDLDKLWGDMRVLGTAAKDRSGSAVAYGDINGDGYNDIIIGAIWADPGDPPLSGEQPGRGALRQEQLLIELLLV